MNIFTKDDYRKIQAWLKANSIKDSDLTSVNDTIPEEDTLVLIQKINGILSNVKINIKNLINSTLSKVIIDTIIANAVKVNNILTVTASNVKIDNEKGTTLQDIIDWTETIEKVAKGWNIEYQVPSIDEPTVRAKYVLKDSKGVPKGDVIKVYKDSAITNVYLGTTKDTCNENTGEVTKEPVQNNNEALSIVYRLDTGKYSLVNVPIGIFTREAEFDKYRGLGVTENGQVFVKLASDVESSNYLHFNNMGEVSADGIENRILQDLGTIINSVANDGTMWGQYKKEEGTKNSPINEVSRWGQYKQAEADRNERLNNLENQIEEEKVAIIGTNRIADEAVTSEKISSSTFDDTLSVSGKIAPADVVGSKLSKIETEVDNIKTFVYKKIDVWNYNDSTKIPIGGYGYSIASKKIFYREDIDSVIRYSIYGELWEYDGNRYVYTSNGLINLDYSEHLNVIDEELGKFSQHYAVSVKRNTALNYVPITLNKPLKQFHYYILRVEYDPSILSQQPNISANYLTVFSSYEANKDCKVLCVKNTNQLLFYLTADKVIESGYIKIDIAEYTDVLNEACREVFNKKLDPVPGVNLFNEDSLFKGMRMTPNGIVMDTNRVAITDKIPWGEQEYMSLNCACPDFLIAQYDSDDKQIGDWINPQSHGNFTIRRYEGAEYARFTILYLFDGLSTTKEHKWQIQYGQTITKYEPYNPYGGITVGRSPLPIITASRYESKMAELDAKQRIPLSRTQEYGEVIRVSVSTEEELNSISTTVATLYSQGKKNIVFVLKPGVYCYKANSLEIKNKNYTDLSVSITSEGGAVLIGARNKDNTVSKYTINDEGVYFEKDCWCVPCQRKLFYVKKYTMDGGKTYYYQYFIDSVVSKDGLVAISSIVDDKELQVSLTSNLVEIVDTDAATLNLTSHDETLCRVKCNIERNYSEEECKNAVLFTNWRWTGNYSRIQKIEDGYIYFYYAGIKAGNSASYTTVTIDGKQYQKPDRWSVNDDIHYNKLKQLRYSIHNLGTNGVSVNNGILRVPYNISEVYITTQSPFSTIEDSTIGYLGISNIKFLGNSFNPYTHCINLKGAVFTDLMEVKHCECEGLGGGFLNATGNSKNIVIEDSSFVKCSNRAIINISNKTENIQVAHCYFEENNCIRQYAYYAIDAKGKNFYVGYNTFKNPWHAPVGLGELVIGVNVPNTTEVSGICEFNKVYSDERFMQMMHIAGPNDWGAIYTNPNSTKTIIRYNFIAHISGPCEGVGIYNDDGSAGISEYCNIIIDIPKSDSLYFRRSINSETDNQNTQATASGKFFHNTNNFVLYNFVFGSFKFQGRTMFGTQNVDESNVLGKNFVFYDTDTLPSIKVDTLLSNEDVILIKGNYKIVDFKVILDNVIYNQLKLLRINNKFFKTFFNTNHN